MEEREESEAKECRISEARGPMVREEARSDLCGFEGAKPKLRSAKGRKKRKPKSRSKNLPVKSEGSQEAVRLPIGGKRRRGSERVWALPNFR